MKLSTITGSQAGKKKKNAPSTLNVISNRLDRPLPKADFKPALYWTYRWSKTNTFWNVPDIKIIQSNMKTVDRKHRKHRIESTETNIMRGNYLLTLMLSTNNRQEEKTTEKNRGDDLERFFSFL